MRALLCLLVGMWGVGAAQAQASTASGVLLAMAGQAAVIFSGSVDAVTRSDAAGYIDVRFRVERGVKGAHDGGIYVLREWAGLWTGGDVRYSVGQRRLMLLAGRGPSGMSAPVGGMDGAVPLFTDADGVVRVDLRWVRAQALRGFAPESQDGGQAHEDPFAGDWAGPVMPMVNGGPGSPEMTLDAVLALLGGPVGR